MDRQLRTEALPADVRKVIVGEEEQQECSPSLDQEDPDPLHIKEEQEEVWTSQEREQLQGLEEADIKFTFSPVPVKSEDDEEKPQSSQLHQRQTEQMKTEADGDDCGSEAARKSQTLLPLETDPSDFSEHETDDSEDWKDNSEQRSGLISLEKVPSSDVVVPNMMCDSGERSKANNCGHDCADKTSDSSKPGATGKKLFSCSECGKQFCCRRNLKGHMMIHTGEKPFSCSVCAKRFNKKGNLQTHMFIHTEEKLFSCSECGKQFSLQTNLKRHMITHTGETPFSCSECGKRFSFQTNLKRHMIIHTGEKPYSCSECDKQFSCWRNLKRHMITHTGEKPYSCSVCGKTFTQPGLRYHMKTHTGEKPFGCSECGKRFICKSSLKIHMMIHTGAKSCSCSVCGKLLNSKRNLQIHMKIHSRETT